MDPTFSVTDLTEVELQELRKTDAWLPSEATRQCLLEINSHGPRTSPRLLSPTDTSEPVHQYLELRYRSATRADSIRPIITADLVSQDCEGLIQLINDRWYHAALDLTGRLLTAAGHAFDTGAVLTSFTSQLWLVRFVLLKQTQQFGLLESELAAFDRLDNPDVYFEHSPALYPGRKGSMIPFSLRLLHAELPHYLKRSREALDRLYFLAAVISRMISNLNNGYTEDGSELCPSDAYKKNSLVIWRRRECKVFSSCLSIYLALKDYPSAVETVYQMIDELKPLGEHRFLYGTLGRIYLEFGDVESAEGMFDEALKEAPADLPATKIQRLMYSAMLQIANGRFDEAKRLFREVLDLDPLNVAATNNQAVSSHYTGQMEEGMRLLEALTTPSQRQQQQLGVMSSGATFHSVVGEGLALHDAIVTNLAILLEVESDHAPTRKMHLLERIAGLTGERVALAAFKLPQI